MLKHEYTVARSKNQWRVRHLSILFLLGRNCKEVKHIMIMIIAILLFILCDI